MRYIKTLHLASFDGNIGSDLNYDGLKKAINEHVGEYYMEYIQHTVDSGFFETPSNLPNYYRQKNVLYEKLNSSLSY